MLMMDIVMNMVSANVLAVNYREISLSRVEIGKMLIEHKRLLPYLLNQRREAAVVKTLLIMQLENPILYRLSETDIMFIIQATDAPVKNRRKRAPFYVNAFQRITRALLDKVRVPHFGASRGYFNFCVVS